MAADVNVNISALEELSTLLDKTLPMLDRLQIEHFDSIQAIQKKIDIVLDNYTARMSHAFDKYQTAAMDLEYAKQNYEDVPCYYYCALVESQCEYEKLQERCLEINCIKASYWSSVNKSKKSLLDLAASYSGVIKKSELFLAKYADLLRQSQSVFSGEYTESGISTHSFSPVENNFTQLTATTQIWKTSLDGTTIFDSPVETGAILDANQGKVAGFEGTCGLVSCVNILRLAGVNITEEQIVNYASDNSLCDKGNPCAGDNGGTSFINRQAILAHFGVHSEIVASDITNIASAISKGKGVIASFDAGRLWDDPDYYGGGHAVTITSVKKDSSGSILGFYLCDSGTGGKDCSKYYAASHIANSLSGRPLNVTSIIR